MEPHCNHCGAPQQKKETFRKILYERQNFPDTYTDESFLAKLILNANKRRYDYWAVVRESAVVTQQISAVVIFVVAFGYALDGSITVNFLITTSSIVTMLCYVMWFLTSWWPDIKHDMLVEHAKIVGVFFITLLALSPVLQTLTSPVSNDTIYALSIFFLFVNVVTHDYGQQHNPMNLNSPLSLNAAIFASVLLASRLPSHVHVFAIVTLAIELFALFPIWRHHLKTFSQDQFLALTCFLFVGSAALLMAMSKFLGILFVCSILFGTFVCPFWLIWIQRYKNEINGPWDEAVVRTTLAVAAS